MIFCNPKTISSKGLTLIESVISLMILSIAVGAVLGTFVVGRVGAAKTKHRIVAMNLCCARMEWAKEQSSATLTGLVGSGSTESDVAGSELMAETRQTQVVLDGNLNFIVTVTMQWTERAWGGSNAATEELVTVINRWGS